MSFCQGWQFFERSSWLTLKIENFWCQFKARLRAFPATTVPFDHDPF